MTIFIWKLFALYVVGSIALSLIIGPVIRWGLGDDEPPELPPLPSGSLHDDETGSILGNHRERELSR